jgi:glycosyltransferase involved in cell wall biosynthesis
MADKNSVAPSGGPVVGHLLANAGMGGAETYVSLIANTHARNGSGSKVIVLSEPGPVSERFESLVDVLYLGYRRASIKNPFRFAASVVRGYRLIAATIRDEAIDVLQTHLPDTNLWGLALSLTGRCRVVITIHNNQFLRGLEKKSFANFVKIRAYRLMFSRCAAIVTVSAEVRNSLLSTLGIAESQAGSVVVVDNGVPVPEDQSPAERLQVREKYGVGADEFWIVAAGRLTEAKNFQCLVSAAARLRDEIPPFRILIAGEGSLRPDLERQIAELGLADRIVLPGVIHDLGAIMQAADLLAMPSLWEGLPMVLLEAMARKLPVVGTRINGLVDVIEENRHGILVEVNDSDAFAEAVTRLALDPEARRGMGCACRDWVELKYSFSRVYSDLRQVYDRVAAQER